PARPGVVRCARDRRGAHRDRVRPQQPDRGPLTMPKTSTASVAGVVGIGGLVGVAAVAAAALAGCWSDERPIQWSRPRDVIGPIALKAQVAYIDPALDRV